SDRGQIWLVQSAETHVFALTPNEHDLSNAKKVNSSKSDVDQLIAFINANQDLKEFDSSSFDGVQYEFVQAKRDESGFKITKRIFMNNPKEDSSHGKLTQFFYRLLP